MFVLNDFKAQEAAQGQQDRRPALSRWTTGWSSCWTGSPENASPRPDDFVFLEPQREAVDGQRRPLPDAALRKKLSLRPDDNGEKIVAYTMRHTAATQGVYQRGARPRAGRTHGAHLTRTTQRYQHPQAKHLSEAIRQANARGSVAKNTVALVARGRGSGDGRCLSLALSATCQERLPVLRRMRYEWPLWVADKSILGRFRHADGPPSTTEHRVVGNASQPLDVHRLESCSAVAGRSILLMPCTPSFAHFLSACGQESVAGQIKEG